MAVIGCDIAVGCVVGAEQLGETKAGFWTKTHFYEKGGFLYSRTYAVAAGEPVVFEFRIDLRPLIKVATKLHARLHAQMQERLSASGSGPTPDPRSPTPSVGFSFSKAFKSIKNTAKKIGKNKLVGAVGKGLKAVVKSKLTGSILAGIAVVVPAVGVPALAAYGAANAALKAVDKGKQLVHTAQSAQHVITKAADVRAKLTVAKTAAPAQVARATAAVQHPAQAKAVAARVVAPIQAAQAKAAPLLAQAARIEQKLADPAVRAKLTTIKTQADSAKTALATVAAGLKSPDPATKLDAQKSAAIVNLVAKNNAFLQAASQKNAGGLPSLLIDGKGRIVPGKFRVVAKAGGRNRDVLYTGPKDKPQPGAFARVSGAFDDDPEIGAAQWSSGPQAGGALYAGDKVKFFVDRKSHNGRIVSKSAHAPGHLVIQATRKSGGRIHTSVPSSNVYAVDLKDRTLRDRFRSDPSTSHRVAGTWEDDPEIGAPAGAHSHWWTLEIKPAASPRWVSLQPNGILFREHWQASKAVGWYAARKIPAKAVIAKYTPTPSELRKAQNLIGAASPFPPLSPREKQQKSAEYEAWLKKHAPRTGAGVRGPGSGRSRVGAWSIGCDCEGTQF